MLTSKFKEKLLLKHLGTDTYPPTSVVANIITSILLTLFPQQARERVNNEEELNKRIEKHRLDLIKIFKIIRDKIDLSPEDLAVKYIECLERIHEELSQDVVCILNGDPAAKSEYEVVRTYPGFYAIAFYRMAHQLHLLNVPLLPRMLTEFAHSRTGIDIHPGAIIAPSFFIDHGTGITIGETANIGKNVKLYQGVTLGALSVSKDMANTKRHPTIEENVVIYSGATILGGETVIGKNSIIGGNVWLTHSVPAFSKVYHKEQVDLRTSI